MSFWRRGLPVAAVLAAFGCSGPAPDEAVAGAQPAAQAQTYTAEQLLGWPRAGEANWRAVEGGAVQADAGSGGYLVTPDDYADFEVSAEFWVTPEANSGVFVRCTDPSAPGAGNCYEVNIFDQRPDQTYRTGGIVDVAAPTRVVYTGGRWNRMMVTARGPELRVVLNDHPVVEVRDERLRSGRIALQYGSGTVLFRNVRIDRR